MPGNHARTSAHDPKRPAASDASIQRRGCVTFVSVSGCVNWLRQAAGTWRTVPRPDGERGTFTNARCCPCPRCSESSWSASRRGTQKARKCGLSLSRGDRLKSRSEQVRHNACFGFASLREAEEEAACFDQRRRRADRAAARDGRGDRVVPAPHPQRPSSVAWISWIAGPGGMPSSSRSTVRACSYTRRASATLPRAARARMSRA